MSTGQIKKEATEAGPAQASTKVNEPLRPMLHTDHQKKRPQKTSLFKLCLEDDTRPGIGVCMIAFSIPLLVPGITLTAVAFNDETGFAKFSALHVLGMFMLAASGMLLVAGILMRIKFRAKVAPDQLLSTHERSSKELESQGSAAFHSDSKTVNSPLRDSGGRNSTPPVNFMIESGNASAEGDHHVHFSNLKKAGSSASEIDGLPSKFTLRGHDNPAMTNEYQEYCTSSGDDSDGSSFDSEEISSGSYVIGDQPSSKRQSMESENSKSLYDRTLQLAGINSSLPHSGLQQTQEQNRMKANSVSTNNYFTEPQSTHSIQNVHPSQFSFADGGIPPRNSGSEQDRPQGISSFSRQRLQALRSDTNSPSSLSRVQSTDLASSNNSAADLRGRCDSNASVFLSDNARRENPEMANTIASQVKQDSSNVRWSFPVGTEGGTGSKPLVHSVRQSSGPLCRTSSLGQEHVARPSSAEVKADETKSFKITRHRPTSAGQDSPPRVRLKYFKRRILQHAEPNGLSPILKGNDHSLENLSVSEPLHETGKSQHSENSVHSSLDNNVDHSLNSYHAEDELPTSQNLDPKELDCSSDHDPEELHGSNGLDLDGSRTSGDPGSARVEMSTFTENHQR